MRGVFQLTYGVRTLQAIVGMQRPISKKEGNEPRLRLMEGKDWSQEFFEHREIPLRNKKNMRS
jgi:hypothetical protein